GGVGAAAEPENVNLIAGLVGLHEDAVAVFHVAQKPGAKGEALDHIPALGNLRTEPALRHGPDARIIERQLALITEGDLVGAQHVGVVAGELVIGAVATKDDFFGHKKGGANAGGRKGSKAE